jgi:hypothetical protein
MAAAESLLDENIWIGSRPRSVSERMSRISAPSAWPTWRYSFSGSIMKKERFLYLFASRVRSILDVKLFPEPELPIIITFWFMRRRGSYIIGAPVMLLTL